MINNYKEYNNLGQQDKESAIAKAAENSNSNENTIIANTDQVEGLLSDILADVSNHLATIEGKLDNIEGEITTVKTAVDGTTQEVTRQGQAIVQAIGQ